MKILLALFLFGNFVAFGSTLDPRCPPNNDGLAVHLPHETDCTKFYKCDWGHPVLQHCPDGLHFNRVLQVCDWPASANCEPGGTPVDTTTPGGLPDDTTPDDTTPDDMTPDETTPTEPIAEGTTPEGPGGSTLDPRCPPNNDGLAVHLPHETDCTKFYKCDWGHPVLQHCPDGLHFNRVLQVCDWPASANCEPGEALVEGTTRDGGLSEAPTPTEPSVVNTTPGNGELDDRCPLLNPELVIILPHDYDCTKFYKCDWGRLFLFNCPRDLHFNRVLSVCDWPEAAGCPV